MKKMFCIMILGAVLTVSDFTFAHYTGPGAIPVAKSIADILATAKDDTPIELEGYIVKQLTTDKFLFSDGTSQIRVEIDAHIFPKTPINEKTRVRIRGEFEKDFLESPEIDVSNLEVLE